MTAPSDRILNAQAITDIFGDWPSFHDAEVLCVRLDHGGASSSPQPEAEIHLFELASEVTPDGLYKLRQRTLVTLLFEGIDELSPDGFNQQNVLFDLSLNDISEPELGIPKWEVGFNASFGMSARFWCQGISVLRAEPFEPMPS